MFIPLFAGLFVQSVQKNNKPRSFQLGGWEEKQCSSVWIGLLMWVCRKFIEDGAGVKSVCFVGDKLLI